MADTVDLNEITEFYDDDATLTAKVDQLARLMKTSHHCLFFTGAGISTSAAIPDFRGPNGVWTCQAKGVAAPDCVPLVQAIPTATHDFMQRAIADGTVKYIVSQNIDGLHRRSGVPRDRISELHGNTFLEVCWGCGADYEHAVEVDGGLHRPKQCKECLKKVPHFCHCTGRKCVKCGGMLRDSIIHFGENLPKAALSKGYEHANAADLCVVWGSSLRVSPANDIPHTVAERGFPLVIINLQTTPQDGEATLRIFAKTDDVTARLVRALDALSGDAADGGAASAAPVRERASRRS